MEKIVTLDTFRDENVAIMKEGKLAFITVKNEKDEELALKEIFDNIFSYIEKNKEKIDDSIALIGSYINGPFSNLKRAFILGYLYCKVIDKLEKKDNTKYTIEYTERTITKEEHKTLMIELLKKNVETNKDIIKKLTDNDIDINELTW